MVRVRFASSSGRVIEGLCRTSDLQIAQPVAPAASVPTAGIKPPGAEYNDRDWLENSDGHRQAVECQNKFDVQMLIFFYTDWNESCEFLWEELLNTSDFKNQTKTIIKVRINPERGKEEGTIAAKYNLRKYPSTFMIDKPHAAARRIDLMFWSFGKMKTLNVEKTLLEIAGGMATQQVQQTGDPTNAPAGRWNW
jgi:hypothetical protein